MLILFEWILSLNKHMVFYRYYKNNFWHLLSCLRNAILAGQNVFIYSLQNLKDYKILLLLQNEGLIRGFEMRGGYIIFNLRSLRIGQYNNFIKTIDGISRPRREKKKATLSFNNINKICNRQGRHPLYVLSTDCGIVTNWEAKKKGVGGFPLVKFF